MKLLIKHGRVVDPVSGTVSIQDLYIENGKVVQLEKDIRQEADQVIDADGLVVCPGLVDMHVHLRDPGLTYKEDIFTGTAAAAHGGVTSVACMANTDPVVDTPEQVRYVKDKAAQANGVHVYPIAAVSMGMRGEEPSDADALKKAGAIALSDDGCNVDNANLMRDVMIHAKRLEMPVLCHCEDTTMVEGRAVNEGSVSRQLWLEGRPAIAEEIMVMRDAMLAEETGAHVHICHVSTAKSVDIIRRMKKRGVAITCETCPQYFTLTEDEILTQGSMARVNPPLRTAKDIKGIITLTELYHTGKMKLPEIIKRMTYTPASILRLSSKGRLSLGSDADITIFDPEEVWTIDPEQFASKARNTPFAGREVKGKVKYTIVGGNVIYQDR